MKIEERTKKDRETELTESVDKEIHEHCGCGEHISSDCSDSSHFRSPLTHEYVPFPDS